MALRSADKHDDVGFDANNWYSVFRQVVLTIWSRNIGGNFGNCLEVVDYEWVFSVYHVALLL